MAGGSRDSSKTRVRPVFDALWQRGRDWLPDLLTLLENGCPSAHVDTRANLQLLEGYWEPREHTLAPPVALLSWLIRNAAHTGRPADADEQRQRLFEGDPATVALALRLLCSEPTDRAWYIFEGRTHPDVF